MPICLGGLHEEALGLGQRVLVLRETTERLEGGMPTPCNSSDPRGSRLSTGPCDCWEMS